MNRRKLTKFLDHRAVRSLDAARYYAETLGHPLNCFVTIAPCRGLVVHSQASADYFASIRNWIGIWIRRRNIRFTAIWTIENNSGGTDPHMHILMHVTAQLISDFRTALARQYPGDSVTHVRPDDGKAKLHSSGYQGSTLNYMRKQMSPQAWWALNKRVRRSNGGPFLGRRWGTTANISTRAQGRSRFHNKAIAGPREIWCRAHVNEPACNLDSAFTSNLVKTGSLWADGDQVATTQKDGFATCSVRGLTFMN